MTSAAENPSQVAPSAAEAVRAEPTVSDALASRHAGEIPSAATHEQTPPVETRTGLWSSGLNSAAVLPQGSQAGGSSRPSDATFVSASPPFSQPEIAAPSAANLVGQRLDHFEILELVGGGGMGLVYRAQDTALNRVVAIKVLSAQRVADEDTVRRFRNEAQSAARLDHANIARVYYVGEARGLNYIVLEYIDGPNLRDLVAEQGPLAVDQALGYAVQLAHALEHASSRGVVHRDIKPSNVLVTPDGLAKLVDMGLSRYQEPGDDDDLTASGVTLGTFDYISPEQARDPRQADVRSDVYSLGCTLFYLLTSQPPFPDGNAMQKLLQHQGDEPPDLSQLNPATPDGLARIVRKMLAKNPGRRYQDAQSLLIDLSLLCAQLGIEFPQGGVTLVLPTPSRWRQAMHQIVPWLAPLAAMLLCVLVLDRLWARRAGDYEARAAQARGVGWDPSTNDSVPEAVGPLAGDASPAAQPAVNGPPAPEMVEPVAVSPDGDDTPARVAGAGALNGPAVAEDAAKSAAGSSVPPSPAIALPPNVLVVDPAASPAAGSQAFEFPSLAAAVERLDRTRNMIELRYSGRREEKPLRLNKLGNVTIQAAAGYQPIVEFKPTSPNEENYAAQMIRLSDTNLTLVNVAFEFQSPPQTTREGGWVLVSLLRANLELQGCTLTAACDTDERKKVSFFAAEGEATSSAMMMMSTDTPSASDAGISIRLRDCLVRGDAALVRAHVPLKFDWSNGLAALTEPLFRGDSKMASRRGQWNLSLDHVTADLRDGLCILKGGVHMPETRIHCQNSILICPEEAALIRQTGDDTVPNQKQKLVWSGNQHLYDGVKSFWEVSDMQGRTNAERRTASDWLNHWSPNETPAARDVADLGWMMAPSANSKLLRDRGPGDYALRSGSPAVGKAAGGRDVGARLSELPRSPLRESPRRASPEASPQEKPGDEASR